MIKLRSTSAVLLLCASLVPGGAFAAKGVPDNNMPSGTSERAAMAAGPALSNHGHFVCTAAITSSGGVFSGEYVNASQTQHLGTGTYQVAFNSPCADVRIANGWFRIAQPDTLSVGTLPAVSCITADRVTNTSAVWLQCYNGAGALVDTSFTLSVSR